MERSAARRAGASKCDLRFQITGHRIWSDYIHEEKEGAQ